MRKKLYQQIQERYSAKSSLGKICLEAADRQATSKRISEKRKLDTAADG